MTAPFYAAMRAVRSVHDGDATRLLDQARRWATTLEAENAVLTARVGTAREYVRGLICTCEWAEFVFGLVLAQQCDRCQLLALLGGRT